MGNQHTELDLSEFGCPHSPPPPKKKIPVIIKKKKSASACNSTFECKQHYITQFLVVSTQSEHQLLKLETNSENINPVADIESPSPTVFRGCLHTNTGLRAKWNPSFFQVIIGLLSFRDLSLSPLNSLNFSGNFSVTRSGSGDSTSQAWIPATLVPAPTADGLLLQAEGWIPIIW